MPHSECGSTLLPTHLHYLQCQGSTLRHLSRNMFPRVRVAGHSSLLGPSPLGTFEAPWLLPLDLHGLCQDAPGSGFISKRKRNLKRKLEIKNSLGTSSSTTWWRFGLMHPMPTLWVHWWGSSHQLTSHPPLSIFGGRDPSGSPRIWFPVSPPASSLCPVRCAGKFLAASAAVAPVPLTRPCWGPGHIFLCHPACASSHAGTACS